MLLDVNGFDATAERDGATALRRFEDEPFDLVILDLMLPGVPGLDLCRELRAVSPVPILILTARTETAMLVAGLECGADDYVAKPFDAAALVARIRALLRRAAMGAPPGEQTIGDLRIDTAGYRLFKRDRPVALTATEFRLLNELVDHPGQVLTREALLNRVWGYDYLGDSRLVDMAVKRLRDKIEDDPSRPRVVVTVRGVGYRLDATNQ